ncbi:MAG: ABC transporter substrate-binding protein [Lentisphaeria bacterium]|nr:ABC transporter substrate-binding protein [Lentisphaeria bacterium]
MQPYTRQPFFRLAAVLLPLLVGMLSGQATPAPSYREAPMLAARVAAGDLPPVHERLPDSPQVVEPVAEVGVYGGTWRRLGVSPSDSLLGSRLGYEPLVRWDRTGRHPVPSLAKSWEVRDDGRTCVLHLRPGLKWSDGHPFTAEDLMFWFEDVVGNKDLTPVFPSYLSPAGGRFTVSSDDPYSVSFHFEKPNGIFLETLCYRGHSILFPKHYLKQFHIHYQSKESLEKEADKEGLDLWSQLFWQRANIHDNTERPTLRAWKIVVAPPATRLLVERNPYYWKVDTAGNQLPYIDRIGTIILQNKEVLNLKAMTGGVDMQARYIDSSKFTLFMRNRQKGKYRVLADPNPTATVIYLNNSSKDPDMRPVLCDVRFRRALSVAINRPELIELIYSGLAVPSNGVSSEFDPYYLPEFAKPNTQYDPDLANRLLDEAGLKKGRGGIRRMPDGKPFLQILNYYPAETGTGPELWQLVAEYWREVGLRFVVKSDARTLSAMQARNGNTNFWAYAIAGIHWAVDPGWYVPTRDGTYFAPAYGRWVAREGRSGEEPTAEFAHLLGIYREMSHTTNNESHKRQLGQSILRQWVEQCYMVGIVYKRDLTIVSDRMGNFPSSMIHDYRLMAPGYLHPEQFFLRADNHAGENTP